MNAYVRHAGVVACTGVVARVGAERYMYVNADGGISTPNPLTLIQTQGSCGRRFGITGRR